MVRGGYTPPVFKNSTGNVALIANKGGIGKYAVLFDQQGQEVGSLQKKGISPDSKGKPKPAFDGLF